MAKLSQLFDLIKTETVEDTDVIAAVRDIEGAPEDVAFTVGDLLDDKAPLSAINNDPEFYEQGTWEPTMFFGGSSDGFSYSERHGEYIKIGNKVWFTLIVNLTSKGSGSGVVEISLPFSVKDVFSTSSDTAHAYAQGNSGAANARILYGTIRSDSERLRLRGLSDTGGGGVSNLNDGDVTNSFSLRISGSYITS